MDYRIAEFIRFIDGVEDFDEVINEAKADTWSKGREHAAILLEDGKLALVRGGMDGILLVEHDQGSLAIAIEGTMCRVSNLAWHTHPRPTGPSEHDCALLEQLGQESSVIYELRGDPAGTRFRRKVRRVEG